eukprot:6584743-Pyramimonas_sp.AAC.1
MANENTSVLVVGMAPCGAQAKPKPADVSGGERNSNSTRAGGTTTGGAPIPPPPDQGAAWPAQHRRERLLGGRARRLEATDARRRTRTQRSLRVSFGRTHRREQLGGHPEGRAEESARLLFHREAKVGKLGLEVGPHQHVGSLEVVHAGHDPFEDVHHDVLKGHGAVGEQVVQGPVLHVLHYHHRLLLLAARHRAHHRHYVRVPHVYHELRMCTINHNRRCPGQRRSCLSISVRIRDSCRDAHAERA